jgi:hypothetical protein
MGSSRDSFQVIQRHARLFLAGSDDNDEEDGQHLPLLRNPLQRLPTHLLYGPCRVHPFINLSQTSTNLFLNIPLSCAFTHLPSPHHQDTIATMQLSTVFAAAMALMMPAAVFGQNIGDPVITSVLVVEYVPAVSTSTVYQTTQFTVWSCAPDVLNCPARSATSLALVTAVVGMSTTICPLTFISTRVSSYTAPATTSYASSSPGATVSSASAISTTYSTASSTVTIGSSSSHSWSYWSTISYSATSTESIVTTQTTLYSGGPSLPTGWSISSTSSGSAGSGLASDSASSVSSVSASASASASASPLSSASSSASVYNPTGASSSATSSTNVITTSASAVVSTSVAANGSSYTISYSPLGTGSLTSQIISGPGSTNNISVPSGPTGSGPLPTYTGMAGRETVMTALSALALGMVAALVLV